MESPCITVYYLTKSDILLIQKEMTLRFGGLVLSDTNIKNQEAFDYMLDAPSSFSFGTEVYPTVYLKAAVYMHLIICGHIFHDGNKRTGLAAALLFLEKNNVMLKSDVINQDLIDFTVHVASNCGINEETLSTGSITIEEIGQWFNKNTYSIGFLSLNNSLYYPAISKNFTCSSKPTNIYKCDTRLDTGTNTCKTLRLAWLLRPDTQLNHHQDFQPAHYMGFAKMQADVICVSSFVFQFCCISSLTSYIHL